MAAAKFDRAVSQFPRSLAAQRFRTDMATVNGYYWLGRLAEGGLTKEIKRHASDADPIEALSLPKFYERRLGHDVARLAGMAETSTLWRRLLTLVMMSSALERYLASIARIAVEADPLLKPGFPKIVDGALLLKRDILTFERDLTAITVGEWQQRISTYRGLFGSVPTILTDATGDLEFVRKTRNRVAHALGVDDEFGKDSTAGSAVIPVLLEARRPHLTDHARVSEDRLTALMGVLQRTVDAVDKHLLSEFIGAYETVATYLEWKKDPDAFEKRAGINLVGHRRQQDHRFGNVIGELFGAGHGTARMKELDAFIKSL